MGKFYLSTKSLLMGDPMIRGKVASSLLRIGFQVLPAGLRGVRGDQGVRGPALVLVVAPRAAPAPLPTISARGSSSRAVWAAMGTTGEEHLHGKLTSREIARPDPWFLTVKKSGEKKHLALDKEPGYRMTSVLCSTLKMEQCSDSLYAQCVDPTSERHTGPTCGWHVNRSRPWESTGVVDCS